MDVLKKYIYQVRGVSYKPSDVCDENKGVPILRAGNICDNRICLDDIVCIDSSKIRPEQFLRDGDVLICASSGSKSVVGKAAIYKLNNFISAFGAFCKVVRIKEGENVLADFIRLYFSSKFYREQISNKSQGANINNIKTDDIDSLLINIPDIQTQNIAVSELDKIQSALANKKEQLKKLDELVQSKFYEMFGDPVVNDMGWEVEKLGMQAKVKGGYAFKSSLFEASGIPVLRIGNINSGKLRLESIVFYAEDEKLSKYLIYPNDLVISLTGTAGKDDYANVCKIDDSFNQYYLNQRNAKIELSKNIVVEYMQSLLKDRDIKLKLTGINRGVRQGNISNKDIENLIIPLPPLPLQQAFAAYVEKVEQAKAIVSQEIAHLQELLDSRMDFYFRK